jgi:hypothetical protein
MQADIVSLIIFDLNRKFRLFNTFGSFDVGPNDVIRLAGWDALCKLTTTVRDPFPVRLFLVRTPDFYANARGRLVCFRPYGAKDQCVGLARLRIVTGQTPKR